MPNLLSASEPDIPWIYVAMMVIYFVAWLFNKIKGARSGEEENEQPERKRTLAEVQENRKRHLQRQAERETSEGDASQALRQLFESIATGEVAEESFLPEAEPEAPVLQAPPVKKATTPPPLAPTFNKTVTKVKLSAAEQKALTDLKSRENSPYQIRKKARSHSLKLMTRGRGLKQAVVLKEILDQPRALHPY